VNVTEKQDLIKCTPTSHADYDLLQNTLSSAQNFIESFDGTSYKEQVCLLACCHLVDEDSLLTVVAQMSWDIQP